MNAEPGWAWVYTHYAADDSTLYVGCTRNLHTRWTCHRNNSPWSADVAYIGVLGPYPRDAALVLEARLIDLNQPPNNTIGTHREADLHAYRGAINSYIGQRCEEMARLGERNWRADGHTEPFPLRPQQYRDWVRRNLTDADREYVRQTALTERVAS